MKHGNDQHRKNKHVEIQKMKDFNASSIKKNRKYLTRKTKILGVTFLTHNIHKKFYLHFSKKFWGVMAVTFLTYNSHKVL
jgi:hypothetical protein